MRRPQKHEKKKKTRGTGAMDYSGELDNEMKSSHTQAIMLIRSFHIQNRSTVPACVVVVGFFFFFLL